MTHCHPSRAIAAITSHNRAETVATYDEIKRHRGSRPWLYRAISPDRLLGLFARTIEDLNLAVTPKEQPVPGSEKEAVFNALERQVRSLNNSEWDGFMELCNPKFLNPPTPRKVKYIWEELGGDFGFFIRGFTTAGYNARNAAVKFPGARSITSTVFRT